MLPPQPCSPSMGWVLGQDRAAGAFGLAGSSHGSTVAVPPGRDTHIALWTELELGRSRFHMVGEVRGCWWDIFLTFSKLPQLG